MEQLLSKIEEYPFIDRTSIKYNKNKNSISLFVSADINPSMNEVISRIEIHYSGQAYIIIIVDPTKKEVERILINDKKLVCAFIINKLNDVKKVYDTMNSL